MGSLKEKNVLIFGPVTIKKRSFSGFEGKCTNLETVSASVKPTKIGDHPLKKNVFDEKILGVCLLGNGKSCSEKDNLYGSPNKK